MQLNARVLWAHGPILILLAFCPLNSQPDRPEIELMKSPPGLLLELQTAKTKYKLGEQIFVTVTIRNSGGQTAFLSSHLMMYEHAIDGWALGTLQLEVKDQLGDSLEPRSVRIADYGRSPKLPLEDFILRSRMQFQPGDFRGFTRPLKRLGFELNKPGRYRLRAFYWERSYRNLVTEEEFEAARKKLMLPWWAKLESAWVEIEIVQ